MIDGKYTIGYFPIVYDNLINEFNHLLIAGSTGSGKSVCLNGIIYTLLYRKSEFIMIDLKRVELIDYKPISLMYCDTVQQAENALYNALSIIDSRYGSMQRKRLKLSDETSIYICIDECADLFLNSRVAKKLVIRIAQIGRAARVHLILCTQCTLAKLLDTQLLVNFDFRIGLRTATKNHSRLIIGADGLETLPFPKTAGFAEMIISKPGSVQKWIMPYIDSEVIKQAIEIRKQKPKRTLLEKIKALFK